MAKNIYCGNLSYDVVSSDLEQLFSEYGTVTNVQVIVDRETGRSKGFAFVEMENNDQAQAAIEALDLREVKGRSMTVNEARPREERGNRGRRGGGGGGGGGRGRRGGRY